MDKQEVIELVEILAEGLESDESDELRDEVESIKAVDPRLGKLVEKLVSALDEMTAYARKVREVEGG